jgi:hypothetical protein
MSQFESLEAQVLEAQRTVDVLGLSEWGDALTVGILTRGLLSIKPKARTDCRETVAMPVSWVKALAEYPHASPAGLDYLARYARRHRFVSIHAASRWLAIERQAGALRGHCEVAATGRATSTRPAPSEGLDQLMARVTMERAASLQSIGGILELVIRRTTFELTEALDARRRVERIRK